MERHRQFTEYIKSLEKNMLYLWKVEILMVTSGWSYVVGVAGETREPTGLGL